MNKKILVKQIAENTKMTQATVDTVLKETMEVIKGAVSAGETVTLVGFGTFKSVVRAERKGRHPGTGEVFVIRAKNTPVFKAGAEFKNLTNK